MDFLSLSVGQCCVFVFGLDGLLCRAHVDKLIDCILFDSEEHM